MYLLQASALAIVLPQAQPKLLPYLVALAIAELGVAVALLFALIQQQI
jgi:hypothetical protein